MSVGLPGSGIGGTFYLLSALWMPFAGVIRAVRGEEPARVRLVTKQTLLALGIVAALFATGWLIEQLLVFSAWVSTMKSGTVAGNPPEIPSVLRTATFAGSAGTLAFVLMSVQVMRLFNRQPAGSAEATMPGQKQVSKKRAA
jgi:hypothetical protein